MFSLVSSITEKDYMVFLDILELIGYALRHEC